MVPSPRRPGQKRLDPVRGVSYTAALLATLVCACAQPPHVAGTWVGRWQGSEGDSAGRFRVHVLQKGNRITGRIVVEGTWFSEARIDGVVEGSRVRWGVLHGGLAVLQFDGTVQGDWASGVYRVPGGAGGRWAARRVRTP